MPVDGPYGASYGRATQSKPVGETVQPLDREGRRRRSNRPRKLSGKRTAGGWVSGKWRARKRGPTDEVRLQRAPKQGLAESFRSPDRGGRERRNPCVA